MKKYVKLYEEFILPEQESNGHPGFFDNYMETKSWLDEQKRLNSYWGEYTIDADTLEVDIEGNVILNIDIRFIPIKFRKINGDFTLIGMKNLRSLKGLPDVVHRKFNCGYCKSLTTLEYLPKTISGSLMIQNCDNLITIKHDSNVAGEDYIYPIVHTIDMENVTQRYINYLINDCPDINSSIDWLQKVDNELFIRMVPSLIDISNTHGIYLGFSDGVKDIASTALKGNHKLR